MSQMYDLFNNTFLISGEIGLFVLINPSFLSNRSGENKMMFHEERGWNFKKLKQS